MVALVALAFTACGAPAVPVAPPGALTLAYTGNVDGEIEPCG
jgi:hypothetical protein